MTIDVNRLRNIGISAHIDSGKTTLTERILYYTKRIHAIHDVKGKDGVGATMDFMDLERERGITITSAATYCEWAGHFINIIDTPGHVDFTIEVERSLRVLDGAILVLCAVGGVQSQSITVARQMGRYRVPRIAFINKCDRSGANPVRVVKQVREKLRQNAVLMQIPIGIEAGFQGVVDLVTMEAIYFDGPSGETVRQGPIPGGLLDEAELRREEMLDAVSLFSDELTEAILEERVTPDLIYNAVRAGTLSLKITPVFLGSAYKNKGVQPLLDGVVHYLACPVDIENRGINLDNNEEEMVVAPDVEAPLVAFAFKLEEGRYGQLTYLRVYRGRLTKGGTIFNIRTGNKLKVGRLARMHADKMEEIEGCTAGDIVAMFGIDCISGDTFSDGRENIVMSYIHVPDPVISLAISTQDNKSQDRVNKALNRFCKEDPTFRARYDQESGQTIISGMGELHLDIYIERMKREYGAVLETGMPQVAYRETISQPAEFDYLHKKQTGGAGQYGRVVGSIEPYPEGRYNFMNKIVGGHIPHEFVPSCDKGFQSCLDKGSLIGFPIINVQVALTDGAAHAVDSSDIAFRQAAIGGFRQAYQKAKPIILEPIMKVVVEVPTEFQGAVMATLNQRRGMIIGTTEESSFSIIEAEVPLAEMFGYSTVLRSATQGKAEFTMEFCRYKQVPQSIAEQLKKEYSEKSASQKAA